MLHRMIAFALAAGILSGSLFLTVAQEGSNERRRFHPCPSSYYERHPRCWICACRRQYSGSRGLFSTTATYTGPAQEIISSAHSGDAAALLQALTREDDDDDDPDTRLSALGSSYQQDPSSTTAALAQALQLANRDAGDVEAIARVTADALIRGGIEGDATKAFSAAYVAARASNSSSLVNIVHSLLPGARAVFSLP